jgi:CDP-diacylglycerol--serine O-phosphatidyltransferase
MLRPPAFKPRRITGLSINRMIPNILTLLALCAGMTAIRFAINGQFEWAVIAIIVAGVFDGLDGRVARMLKSTSPFGAQLDSLSDFICFGVAPGVMLYIWTMSHLASFGWALSLLYAICCGLRLARFNTQLDVELPPYATYFFTGVPAPGGAGLVLVPMYLAFEFGDQVFRSPIFNGIVMIVVAALMVSRVPTFSMKRFRIPHHYVLPVMLGIAVVAAFLTTAPWPTLSAVGLLYVASIPLTVRSFNRLRREAAAQAKETASPDVDLATPSQHHDMHPESRLPH